MLLEYKDAIENYTRFINYNKDDENAYLNRGNAKFRIKPEIGDFYFFPNYMMHTVYPFKDAKEERRSISFNAKIDDEIYNDYS